jgi:hypothetical protein
METAMWLSVHWLKALGPSAVWRTISTEPRFFQSEYRYVRAGKLKFDSQQGQ